MSVKARVSHRSTGTKLPPALQCSWTEHSEHTQPSWAHRAGKEWNGDCERVICFPTSLDARRLNLLAIWGGRNPQGSRNGAGCFLCSQHGNPLRNKGRQTRNLLKYSQLCLRTLQKGEMLLINNVLGTTGMTGLGFCTLYQAD